MRSQQAARHALHRQLEPAETIWTAPATARASAGGKVIEGPAVDDLEEQDIGTDGTR